AATATVAMIVHDDVGDDHRSATATAGGGRSWSPESSRQESTVHRFVAGPADRTPSAHDSDPHTAVPVCRDYGPRYGNRDRSGKPNENRAESNETEEH
ncbi:hypothetical protein ALC56_04486, partial [Trachymyrmex septentrionalis]